MEKNITFTSFSGAMIYVAVLFTALLAKYSLCLVIYNLYLHPVSKIPGPTTWAAGRLPFAYSLLKGTFVQDVRKIHDRYGDVVRLAPNEVSFAKPEAWHDIYEHRPGHEIFPKNPIFFSPPDGEKAPSMVTTTQVADHARMRRLLEKAFTKKALSTHETTVQSYVDLLVSKLREKTDTGRPEDAIVNMVHWYNFTTFDIIGDLSFGESFNCLRDGDYHGWVSIFFEYLKGMTFVATTRYFPLVESLFKKLLPRSIMEKQHTHYQLALDKIHRRLNLEKQRNDFMTPIIELNKDMQYMTMAEIEATFCILVIAGSETTATTLSGITNYVIQNRNALRLLTSEIRNRFKGEKDITTSALKGLPFLNACISEGLRMCNPVPAGLSRLVPAGGDTVCGIWLPGGTHVSTHPYTLHFSAKHFTNPEFFIPERWMPSHPYSPSSPSGRSAVELAVHNGSAIKPFSLGPRSCIGQELAWMEMRLVIARLVWAFDLGIPDGTKPLDWRTLKTYIVVQKKPVMVRLTTRAC